MVNKTGEKLIESAQSVNFLNPFTGKAEPFISTEHAISRSFDEAAKRIAELQEEISTIKAHLVL